MQELFSDDNEQFLLGYASLEDYLAKRRGEIFAARNDLRAGLYFAEVMGTPWRKEELDSLKEEFVAAGRSIKTYSGAIEKLKSGDQTDAIELLCIDIEFYRALKESSMSGGDYREAQYNEEQEMKLRLLYEDCVGE